MWDTYRLLAADFDEYLLKLGKLSFLQNKKGDGKKFVDVV
jgi:hypothetical protein